MTMTEHRKIPLPSEGNTTTELGSSLLERAGRAFDLGSLLPPPVPANLAPAPVKPAQRHRPAANPDVLPPSAAFTPDLSVITEPSAKPTQPATPVQSPVRFTGPIHAIDREHLRLQGMIIPEGSVSKQLEEFRIVKRALLLQAAELRRKGAGPAAQRVLVCSPLPGEGKTFTSVNLALAIAAEKESEVLLVDADFAKPSVLSTLGMAGGPGLMDALANPAIDVADCVLATDIPGLWVLPAGDATASDTEFLGTSHARAVLDRLTQGVTNRIVIFDSPPALAASPAAELAKFTGQALLVARADRTGQGSLEDAISLLSGCANIQLILNAVNFSPSGRRFGTYYGYKG